MNNCVLFCKNSYYDANFAAMNFDVLGKTHICSLRLHYEIANIGKNPLRIFQCKFRTYLPTIRLYLGESQPSKIKYYLSSFFSSGVMAKTLGKIRLYRRDITESRIVRDLENIWAQPLLFFEDLDGISPWPFLSLELFNKDSILYRAWSIFLFFVKFSVDLTLSGLLIDKIRICFCRNSNP
jgi:hypothetical protein